mgnify:CR=1 FL=1
MTSLQQLKLERELGKGAFAHVFLVTFAEQAPDLRPTSARPP